MIKIEVLNSVWSRTNEKGAKHLHDVLSYEHFYWVKNGFRPEKVVQRIFLLEENDDGYYFLTGLVDRACDYFDKKRIKYEFINHMEETTIENPSIEGYKFRHYQKRLIDAAIEYGRGQLISPTATGKSIIILGVTSAFPNENILFLVHTKDLVKQMKADFIKAFPNETIGEWSGQKKDLQRITVATVQSYVKICRENIDRFQVIIIDEAHHVSNLEGQYSDVLMYSGAHTKIGVTATRAANAKGRWSAEALLGPVLAEYTMKEAQSDEVLAKPTIHVYKNGQPPTWIEYVEYEDKYSMGVVLNTQRNIKIVEIAQKFIKEGKTTLITISSIEHGRILESLFKDYGLKIPFIFGESKAKERDKVKDGLKSKKTLCAIASVIFLEGIDIPTLDVVINAGGGVSKVQVMQRIGRALRKTETKDTAILVDFVDDITGTLKRQSDRRINMYRNQDWPILYKTDF